MEIVHPARDQWLMEMQVPQSYPRAFRTRDWPPVVAMTGQSMAYSPLGLSAAEPVQASPKTVGNVHWPHGSSNTPESKGCGPCKWLDYGPSEVNLSLCLTDAFFWRDVSRHSDKAKKTKTKTNQFHSSLVY